MKRLGSIGVFVAGTLCGGLLNLQPWNAVHAVNGEGRQDDGGFTGGAGVCPADIAPPGGDGVVNVDDLLAVISNWGPCVSDDLDNDGWSVAEGDCDDANANVHPGAPELCNGVDDDCDGTIDDGFSDTGSDVCGLATLLGTLNGDTCNGATINASGTLIPAGDEDYFRVHIAEDSSADQDLYARVTLTVPAAAPSALRLCVACETCASASTCIVVNPGQSQTMIMRADDNPFGEDDSFDALVHVEALSPTAPLCQLYQLTITCTPGTPQVTCN